MKASQRDKYKQMINEGQNEVPTLNNRNSTSTRCISKSTARNTKPTRAKTRWNICANWAGFQENEVLSQETAAGQLDLEETGHVEIHGGEVFVGHKRHHNHPEVEIKINKSAHKTHSGKNSIEQLKHLGGVPKDDILSELKNKEFIDFGTEGHVDIHGGEIFVSHRQVSRLWR